MTPHPPTSGTGHPDTADRPDTAPELELLDPKNDYVFKRVFGEHPDLRTAVPE